jgi:hypothetical protein
MAPEEPLSRNKAIRSAIKAQAKIGWDRFFRGRIAKAWRLPPIGTYYKIRQPGESFTPDQWMRTVIKELPLGVLDRHMEATEHGGIAWY